jgi:hypothetical protein
MRKPIDVEELRKTFRINNGELERIDYRSKNGKWKPVKLYSNHTKGYCQVSFNGRTTLHHIVIWILSTGKDIPPDLQIDHINRNKIDNRIENLRMVTNRENNLNKDIYSNGKLFGAYLDTRVNRYYSMIKINGKSIFLGYYKDKKECSKAYEIALENAEYYIDNESFRCMIRKLLPHK